MKNQLTKTIAGFIALLATSAACSAGDTSSSPDGTPGSVAQASGSANVYCRVSEDCSPGFYCSTEGKDCTTPGGCLGECLLDRRARCGENICDDGLVCCNESCGICAAPGAACTQQLCFKKPRPAVEPIEPADTTR